MNLIQALSATISGKPLLARFHRDSFRDFRSSARRLQVTCKSPA
jgi:hypothetical protein